MEINDNNKKMVENPSLYRSFRPKYFKYQEDGTGRDDYIKTNNGGFSIREPCKRSMKISHSTGYLKPMPHFDAKNIRYQSDGSGRDYYIS